MLSGYLGRLPAMTRSLDLRQPLYGEDRERGDLRD
jgi:hypothetical protein